MAANGMHEVELGRIKRQADQLTDESLESTRRMVTLAEETQDIGIKTLVALDEQGDQLNRIEENLDTINADMRKAEKNLTGLEKFCGLCTCCCNRQKDFERSEAYRKGYDNDNYSSSSKSKKGDKGGSGEMASGGYINRVTHDDREEEMDENLGQVAGIVGNLKSMALEMGEELDSQNKQISRVHGKADANQARVEQANKRAESILRK